jgi:hypothetical protein
MKKIFLILLACFPISFATAQTASKKTVDETCACVKKIKANLSEDQKLNEAITCMTGSMGKYMDQLKKEFKVTTADQNAAAREVGSKVGAQMAKDCPEMTPYFLKLAEKQNAKSDQTPDIKIDTLKLDSKVCERYKAGKYNSSLMYMNKKEVENSDPTAYTEVKDGFVYDYSENKKYMTKWSIKWLSGCEWEQTLVESTEPNMKTMFKKGDKIKVKALGSTKAGGLYISTDMMGANFIMLVNKMK